jgi:NTE family protein
MEQSRAAADVLILPRTGGTDIRDWKAYEEPVASGYAATRAALADLPVPVTHLRRRSRAFDL